MFPVESYQDPIVQRRPGRTLPAWSKLLLAALLMLSLVGFDLANPFDNRFSRDEIPRFTDGLPYPYQPVRDVCVLADPRPIYQSVDERLVIQVLNTIDNAQDYGWFIAQCTVTPAGYRLTPWEYDPDEHPDYFQILLSVEVSAFDFGAEYDDITCEPATSPDGNDYHDCQEDRFVEEVTTFVRHNLRLRCGVLTSKPDDHAALMDAVADACVGMLDRLTRTHYRS